MRATPVVWQSPSDNLSLNAIRTSGRCNHVAGQPNYLEMNMAPALSSPSSESHGSDCSPDTLPPAAHEIDEAFEAAVLASDHNIRTSHKRTREAHLKTVGLLKKPRGQAFPFHEPVDVLHCCIQAAAAVAGSTAPEFDLESDPRQVYMWMAKTMIDYGNECREEGVRLERDASEPRLHPQLSGPMLECVTKMTELLSTRRT